MIINELEFETNIRNQDVSFMQTIQWARTRESYWQPKYICINKYYILLLKRKYPFINKYFGYIPRAFKEGVDENTLKSLVTFLKTTGLTHVLIDPQCFGTNNDNIFKSVGFKIGGKTIQPNQTNIIDLTKGEESVFFDMSGNFRKKIRRAVKHGCTVNSVSYKDDENAVNEFFKFMEKIYKRTDFVMYGKEYFRRIWNEFGKIDKARIFFVTYKGKKIGGIFYLYDNNTAYELYGGTSDEGRPIMANYILKCEGIKYAIENGFKQYDQWGVAKSNDSGLTFDTKDQLYNISNFKAGFGGIYTQYLQSQLYVFSKLYYYIYIIGIRLNKLYIKIKSAIRH